jgi:predicted esterase
MPENTYNDLDKQLTDLYQQGKYAEAIQILEPQMEAYPEYKGQTYNFLMCLQALNGQPEAAIEAFRNAQQEGVWWVERVLREDEDLKSLQGREEFERLVETNNQVAKEALATSEPGRLVIEPEEPPARPYPLLIALHGRNSNAADAALYYGRLNLEGWLVVLPESSQMEGWGSHTWDDPQQAEEEVEAHYREILENYEIDVDKVVLSGFSQGAGLALLMGLESEIPARGAILIAPWWANVESINQRAQSPAASDLRVYFITGGKDESKERAQEILEALSEQEIPFEEENHPELGHEFPPDFTRSIERAFEYILKE